MLAVVTIGSNINNFVFFFLRKTGDVIEHDEYFFDKAIHTETITS